MPGAADVEKDPVAPLGGVRVAPLCHSHVTLVEPLVPPVQEMVIELLVTVPVELELMDPEAEAGDAETFATGKYAGSTAFCA